MFLKIFKHAFTRPWKTILLLILIGIIAGIASGICKNVYNDVYAKYLELRRNNYAAAQNSKYKYFSCWKAKPKGVTPVKTVPSAIL